ncbi:hypothetical protein JOD43_000037 [Pullulanibacillus pueri]|uniref:Uncharacterized protein n=1 Tax=Pullulanibacillus pueri TaxID=1437324 RepID=A0A8J2ZRE5_9BACL|nr:hypothetical protein [Pullulanibacillus pueri]MBM7679878.1 hypothetical protein [Pullulanibacillus pueri]GGH73285.1 hypothetical protein GCM10007096_00370 [Pullulanibacillus pueri]
MDEIGQLRIYVSEHYFPIYHELGKTLFTQNSEFFILCTFVGIHLQQSLDVSKKHELCRAITLTEHDWISLRALYYQTQGELGSYKQLTQEAEKYAHAGLTYLIDNDLQDYVLQDEEGNYHLKGHLEDLELQIMDYVMKQKEEVPF